MKYSQEILIHKPLEDVVALFDDPENLKHWMKGLQSFEPIEGTPGQPGARSRLVFKMGKREMEMTETITVRNLPDEFSGIYEARGVHNISRNFFRPEGENSTRYITENEFRFSGIMKLFSFLMPGLFKKQSMKYMEAFRDFAESA